MTIEELELTDDLQQRLKLKIKEDKLTLIEYLQILIKNDLNSKFDLGNGFYYDYTSDKFFNPLDEVIALTKIQKKLLFSLLTNTGKIVSVEQLIKESWPKGKEVSIFSFRNIIKQIRDKTYYEIITSHSNKGYSHGLENTKQHTYNI